MAKKKPKLIHELPPLLDYEIEEIKKMASEGIPAAVVARTYGLRGRQVLELLGETQRERRPFEKKFTDDQVREIRRLVWLMPHKEIMARFGISASSLGRICIGAQRGNVPD
jgi:hypothetical protein